MSRTARHIAFALASLVALFDLAVALVWRQWCREHGYAEQAAELELRTWP
jgi:hypothetical protein